VIDYSVVAIIAALLGGIVFHSVYQAAEDEMLALLAPLMLFIVAASFFAGGERKHK
jgi:glucose uptake protein GlcU